MAIDPQTVFTNQPSTVSSAKQQIAVATNPTLSSVAAVANDGNQMKWFTADREVNGIRAATGFRQQMSNYIIDNGIKDVAVLNLPIHTPISTGKGPITGMRVLALAGNASLHELVSEQPLLSHTVSYDGVATTAKHFAKKGNMDATVCTAAGINHKVAYNERTKVVEYYSMPSSIRTDMVVEHSAANASSLADRNVKAYIDKKIINPAIYERVLDIESGRVTNDDINKATEQFWLEIVEIAKAFVTRLMSQSAVSIRKSDIYMRYQLNDSVFTNAFGLTSGQQLENLVNFYENKIQQIQNNDPSAVVDFSESRVYKYYGLPVSTQGNFENFLVIVANLIDSQRSDGNEPSFLSDADSATLLSTLNWQNLIVTADQNKSVDTYVAPIPQYVTYEADAVLDVGENVPAPNGTGRLIIRKVYPSTFGFQEALSSEKLYYAQAVEAEEAVGNLINQNTNDIKLGLSWIYTDLNYGPIIQTASFNEYGVLGTLHINKSDIPKGVIGVCLWKSTLDKAEDWQLVTQQLFADFITDERIPASDTLDWDSPIEEYVYEEQTIHSSQNGTFYYVAFRADQSQTSLFTDVTGYTGKTLTGYDHIVTAGNFAVVANPCFENEEGAVVSRPDLLNVVPFNSAGSLQEVAVPINTGVQVPELTDDTIYGLTRMDRYIALITNRMVSLFDVSGGGLRHVRNIFGAAPMNRWAWTSDGTSLYSLSQDRLFQITPSGKQPIDSFFNFQDLYEPKLHFDRSMNELIAVSGQRVICMGQSGIYERDYLGPNITHLFDWEGELALVNLDNDDRIDVFVHENEPLDRITIETHPFYLGEPSQTKRITDIWLTINRDVDTDPSQLVLTLRGDADDIQLFETVDLAGTTTERPMTIRFRLKRVIVVDELPKNSPWQLSEVNVDGTTYIRELRVNAANRLSRWFSLRIESTQATDMQIQAIQIGYKTYGSR